MNKTTKFDKPQTPKSWLFPEPPPRYPPEGSSLLPPFDEWVEQEFGLDVEKITSFHYANFKKKRAEILAKKGVKEGRYHVRDWAKERGIPLKDLTKDEYALAKRMKINDMFVRKAYWAKKESQSFTLFLYDQEVTEKFRWFEREWGEDIFKQERKKYFREEDRKEKERREREDKEQGHDPATLEKERKQRDWEMVSRKELLTWSRFVKLETDFIRERQNARFQMFFFFFFFFFFNFSLFYSPFILK